MQALTAIDQLARPQKLYQPLTQEQQDLFTQAMQQADAWHKARNANYAKLWVGEQRPSIPVGLFKKLDLATSVGQEGQWLSSSGTGKTGATEVFFDKGSMQRITQGMLALFIENGFYSSQPARFLLLSPNPQLGDFPGYATAFLKFTAAAPNKALVFTVNPDAVFDAELAIKTLTTWAQEPEPIFIFGLTVFFEQLALALQQPIEFKQPIKGITGGGWKGLTKTMERGQILQRLAQNLQTPMLDIRDMYGMTEHPLHYLSCPLGYFHQPVYSRFFVQGANQQQLEAGEQGLIRLQNPFFASIPAHDIVTEDLGCIGEHCDCGNTQPYLKFLGRATTNEGICAQEALA